MTPEAAGWLRRCVLQRRETAKAAANRGGPEWWRRTGDNGAPDGDLHTGDELRDLDGKIWAGQHTVVYDKGRPSDSEFAHIALNDPRDVIARCEAELQTLDHWESWKGAPSHPAASAYATAVRCVATGYRNWPGWGKHFGQG